MKIILIGILFVLSALLVFYISRPVDLNQGRWVKVKINGQSFNKAALLIPVQIEEVTCFMQFDTGAPNDTYWDNSEDSLGSTLTREIKVLGFTKSVLIPKDAYEKLSKCNNQSVGTIGNGFFSNGTLSINVKTGYLSFDEQSGIDNIESPQGYSLTSSGHILFDINEGENLLGQAMFDTGSASADYLALAKTWWDFFTRQTQLDDNKKVFKFTIQSWGKDLDCYSALSVKNMTVGTTTLQSFSVSYCPELSFATDRPIIGIIGLSFFEDHVLKINYKNQVWAAIPVIDQ